MKIIVTESEKVKFVQDLVRQHGNKFMTVDFVKKDKTLRHMLVHRSKVLEASVKGTQPIATEARRATLKANDMICVEELVKPGCAEHQWRTINCRTVQKICCNGNEFMFA